MTFYAFGVNHLRAPVETREAFALSEEAKRALFRAIRLSPGGELIVLSTCNRTEAYLFGSPRDVKHVQDALCGAAGRPWPENSAFLLQDEEAVRHVLEVAAGLRSMVLGDAQIFSQLKEAYRIAVEEQGVGTTMHRFMHTAFRTAKRVINETDLHTGAASIPYVAVDAACRLFESTDERSVDAMRVLVLGSGSMGRLAIDALKLRGVSTITLSNRSEDRGRVVAEKLGVEFCEWSYLHHACGAHDVVIVATSAESPVVLAASLEAVGVENTMFVDISVPRNVEPGVTALGCRVIDVDALNVWLAETEAMRRTAVPAVRAIVSEMIGEFVTWVFHHQALQPVIQTIADTFEAIRVGEVERHHQRFSEIDQRELDEITRSIVQKILAVPVVRLKSVEPESIDFVRGIRLLHALFRREACEEADVVSGSGHPSPSTAHRSRSTANEPVREDCPIEPQLPRRSALEHISGLELDDVLRLYSSGESHAGPAAPKDEKHTE